MTTEQRITLNEFILRRLGQADDIGLLKTMFVRSFGAGSFREFWRYWNPVYGYYLYYYCYKPLRKILPRPLCVIITFGCSGFFLHDLLFLGWGIRALVKGRVTIPFVTFWFSTMAILMLLAEAVKLDLSNKPLGMRVAVNCLYIALAFVFTFFVVSR